MVTTSDWRAAHLSFVVRLLFFKKKTFSQSSFSFLKRKNQFRRSCCPNELKPVLTE